MLTCKFTKDLFTMSGRAIMKNIRANVSEGLKKKRTKKAKVETIPSSIEFLVVGNGYSGTPKCLLVHTSHLRYMFNCGEGTQRVATEHKKLAGCNKVFVTHGSWQNVGGLIGMSLTMETAEVPKLHLFGPLNVERHISSSRSFSKMEKIELVKEDMNQQSFSDTAMTISFIPIHANPIDHEKEESSPKRLKLSMDEMKENDAIVYLCKPHAKPRNVDLVKCSELNVPVGPHLAVLKEGMEVTLPGTDRIIKPDDILSPCEPNDSFLIVECPTVEHLDSLVTSPGFATFQTNDPSSRICLIIHFTHSSIMNHPLYLDWMKKFGPGTDHMVLNDLCSPLDTEGMYRLQASRNLIHPHIFPLLPLSLHSGEGLMTNKNVCDGGIDSICHARTNTRYIYRPFTTNPFVEDKCIKLDNSKYFQDILKEPATEEFISDWKTNLKDVQETKLTQKNPEIVFLGTGSATPNKYRNVSCILINVGEETSIMLDCGENSCGQMYRFYGVEKAEEKLKKLKAVFVSHLHADHHLGLIGLAIEREKCFKKQSDLPVEPLVVVAPQALLRWYSAITSKDIPIGNLISFLPAESLYLDYGCKDPIYERLLNLFAFTKVQTVRVCHSQYPHGIVLEHKEGWKIVYSGDTMPSSALIQKGKDCDLLIHEATFDRFKVDEAREKKHSTSDQAIDVGRDMNARFIMLTHFSQRYDKVPLFCDKFSDNVGVAFDNMKVKLSDLHILPTFVPAYKVIFRSEYEEMMQVIENKHHRMEFAKNS